MGEFIKSVGEQLQVLKRGISWLQEEYNVDKRERGSNIIVPICNIKFFRKNIYIVGNKG